MAVAPTGFLDGTPEGIAARRKFAAMLMGQGTDASPALHPAQALTRAFQGAVGGYLSHKADEDVRAEQDAGRQALISLLGGAEPSSDSMPPPSRPALTAAVAGGNPPPQGADASLPPPTAGPRSASMPPVTTLPPSPPSPSTASGSMYAGLPGWAPDERPMEAGLRDTPLDAMVPREKVVAALRGATGAPPPMSGATPAGAVPVQTQAITPPAAPAAAPTGVGASLGSGVAPAQRAQLITMLGNRATAPMAQQIITQLATKRLVPTDPKYHRLNDELLFDERTGKTLPAGGGFKPLISPEERAAHGIPAEDKRPYQLGPGNKLINPPPETRVSIDQRAEGEFPKNAAKINAEHFGDIRKAAQANIGMIGDLNALREIGSRITTGKSAEIQEALGPWAEALGIKIDKLGDLQAYNSIVSKMAPRMRPPGTGSSSDRDMAAFFQALPGLGKTPQGNEIIMGTQQALLEHSQAAGDIASRALAGELTPREAEKMIRELPDPMALWRKSRGKSPAAPVTGPLPSGTYNWSPNGVEPVK